MDQSDLPPWKDAAICEKRRDTLLFQRLLSESYPRRSFYGRRLSSSAHGKTTYGPKFTSRRTAIRTRVKRDSHEIVWTRNSFGKFDLHLDAQRTRRRNNVSSNRETEQSMHVGSEYASVLDFASEPGVHSEQLIVTIIVGIARRDVASVRASRTKYERRQNEVDRVRSENVRAPRTCELHVNAARRVNDR